MGHTETDAPVRRSGWIGLGAVTVLIVWAVLANRRRPASEPDGLDATVRASGYELAIDNQSGQVWTDIIALVNGSFRCETLSAIKPKETGRIRLADCATAAGARYSPFTMKVIRVRLEAETSAAGARGVRTFEFRP